MIYFNSKELRRSYIAGGACCPVRSFVQRKSLFQLECFCLEPARRAGLRDIAFEAILFYRHRNQAMQ